MKRLEDAPMVQELEEALEFSARDIIQTDGGLVRFPSAVNHGPLEELFEERRVALQEVAMDAEKRVLHLSPYQYPPRGQCTANTP